MKELVSKTDELKAILIEFKENPFRMNRTIEKIQMLYNNSRPMYHYDKNGNCVGGENPPSERIDFASELAKPVTMAIKTDDYLYVGTPDAIYKFTFSKEEIKEW